MGGLLRLVDCCWVVVLLGFCGAWVFDGCWAVVLLGFCGTRWYPQSLPTSCLHLPSSLLSGYHWFSKGRPKHWQYLEMVGSQCHNSLPVTSFLHKSLGLSWKQLPWCERESCDPDPDNLFWPTEESACLGLGPGSFEAHGICPRTLAQLLGKKTHRPSTSAKIWWYHGS